MIPIRAFKNYWLSIQTRLQDIKHVIFMYNEADLASKIKGIPANEIILAVLVPSSDGLEIDKDNLKDATSALIYVMETADHKNFSEIVELDLMERTQNMIKAVKYLVHQDATTCGNYMHEFLEGVNFGKMHIDPEDNYLSCYGWSMSFYITDPFFTYDDDEFQEAYSLPPVTITDGEETIEKQYGQAYTCQYGNTPAEVVNSDDSYATTVMAPGPLVLPDISFTDSDGTVSQVPACKDIVATPQVPIPDAVVENSDQSYRETFTPPGPKVLPDISFTDSDGSVSQVPACKDIVATPIPDERIMIVQFPAGYDDNMTITAESDQATSWTTETLSNVATVAYEKNGVAASLPITLAEGDTMKITITRTDSEAAASVKLEN